MSDHHQNSHQDHTHHPAPKKKKKVHHRVTKYLMERDTLISTVWVFIFIIVLGLIPLNLGVLNPIKLGLKDFDFNDLYYSKVGNQQRSELDKNIVVINIGQADREGLAYLIEKTAAFQPKVIGLDVIFPVPHPDPVKDSIMLATVKRTKNLVLAGKYVTDSMNKLILSENIFLKDGYQAGYVNFPHDDKECVRTYYPFKKDEKDEKLVFPSFTSAMLKIYKPEAYESISHKVDQKLIINYTRTVTARKKQYLVVEGEDLLTDNVDSSSIKGKIALLAYVNINPNDIEDKKFTPMNEKFAGKSVPDMNGILVHANIISMVLEKNYVKKVPLWGNILLAVLVCWLHMSFFVHYYLEAHIWFHLAAKIAQVASAIFFVWLGIYLYDRFGLKVDMKLSLVTIVMAVDVIYFYEAWAVWMHKKFNFKTVFKPHHH